MAPNIEIPAPVGPRLRECGDWTSLRFGEDGDRVWQVPAQDAPTLVLVTRGRIVLSAERMGRRSLSRGRMALVPAGRRFRWENIGTTRLLLCRFDIAMGCCSDCTAGRLARYLVSGSGSLCATNYSEQIAMILDFTEICIGTSMVHEKPHLFEQHRKDLLFLLYKQFGVDACTPLLPWQEKVLSVIALREESRRELADAIAQPLPVAMDTYFNSYFKLKKNNAVI